MPRKTQIVIELGEHLTIADVHDRKQEWEALLEKKGDIFINGADIKKIDTAGIQLLLALKQTLNLQSRGFNWQSCSEVMLTVATLTDLGKITGIEP